MRLYRTYLARDMYELRISHTAKKALKKLEHHNASATTLFKESLKHLLAGAPLHKKFKDHQLKGHLLPYREYHIGFDVLVIYACDTKGLVVRMVKIGTHDRLF